MLNVNLVIIKTNLTKNVLEKLGIDKYSTKIRKNTLPDISAGASAMRILVDYSFSNLNKPVCIS